MTFTARAASQSLACDQAKMGADASAWSKCGSGRALGKSFAPCNCTGTTIIVTCTTSLSIVCEDK